LALTSDSFPASNPAQRVAALLDPGSFREIARQARGALTAGTGIIGGTGGRERADMFPRPRWRA
jgi:acetyl-CoA carboxylase carboxyltransferase component